MFEYIHESGYFIQAKPFLYRSGGCVLNLNHARCMPTTPSWVFYSINDSCILSIPFYLMRLFYKTMEYLLPLPQNQSGSKVLRSDFPIDRIDFFLVYKDTALLDQPPSLAL